MITNTFNIYKRGNSLELHAFNECSYVSADWRQYLIDTNQEERLQHACEKNARYRSLLAQRIRKTASFRQWAAQHIENIPASTLYGTVTCQYDGRLSEWSIKTAVLEAIRDGRNYAFAEVKSDAAKPAHLRRCYQFTYSFTPIS